METQLSASLKAAEDLVETCEKHLPVVLSCELDDSLHTHVAAEFGSMKDANAKVFV